jgi:hypothetical protein
MGDVIKSVIVPFSKFPDRQVYKYYMYGWYNCDKYHDVFDVLDTDISHIAEILENETASINIRMLTNMKRIETFNKSIW